MPTTHCISSTTPEAAHTIDAMARHGDLWWNCNVVKSSAYFWAPTCWFTEWRWRGRQLQNVDTVKAQVFTCKLTG
jgi:fructosamine-3-kinase